MSDLIDILQQYVHYRLLQIAHILLTPLLYLLQPRLLPISLRLLPHHLPRHQLPNLAMYSSSQLAPSPLPMSSKLTKRPSLSSRLTLVGLFWQRLQTKGRSSGCGAFLAQRSCISSDVGRGRREYIQSILMWYRR